MMLVHTTRFGELEAAENEIITFPQGILGFEAVKEYILLEGSGSFRFLQAVGEPDLTFVVIDPRDIVRDYKAEVPTHEVEEIGVTRPEEAVILAIATVPGDVRKMTVNLQAPLVINAVNRRGKQIVLAEQGYAMRHPVFGTMEETA
ncbi:MAG: flagellar assembly protein FliW [Firmicutes bacterium]|jgi:flagellar assembly factor FliW|nr:flagellar assembly protein FliW [Bacillota bacterium]